MSDFELQRGCFILKRVSPRLSGWVWAFDKFSAGGSASDSDNALQLFALFPQKFFIQRCHYKPQFVAYGALRKAELMLCITCSICLVIVREMILW